MPDQPLAYHITFGMYGSRLHGDARGTVYRSTNKPGEPIIGTSPDWEQIERSLLRFPPVVPTIEQRNFAESVIPAICQRGGWQLHTCAAQLDHVHTLLTTTADAKTVRRLLKRWLGQALSERWPLLPEATWWAEGGSVKWVWNQQYFEKVFSYIENQRTEES
ncbi:MAG: transposase [Phycisphaerales bacterium]